MIEKVALGAVVGITYLGGFSRFTHGRYTPAFYQYQIDRAPDDESTRVIPYIDVTLATLMLVPQTRAVAAAVGVFFQGIGIVMRIKARKPLATDLSLASLAAFVAWTSVMGRP